MICRCLAKAVVLALSLVAASHATSVTYDFYYSYSSPIYGNPPPVLFAEFTAPDFLPYVTPPARVGQNYGALYSNDMAYCAACEASLFGGDFIFQGFKIYDSFAGAQYYDTEGTGYQYSFEMEGVPYSDYAVLGTHYGFNGTVTVQELGKTVTYAPEPASYALVGSSLLTAILQLRRKKA